MSIDRVSESNVGAFFRTLRRIEAERRRSSDKSLSMRLLTELAPGPSGVGPLLSALEADVDDFDTSLTRMENLGLVEVHGEGAEKLISLTSEGKKLVEPR